MGGSAVSHPKINRVEMAANYGFALAFMNSSPELKKLFNRAVAGTWTPDKFVAQLRNTHWFKTHSASVRNSILQQTSDPATWKANVAQMQSQVRDQWGQMFGGNAVSPKVLEAWSKTAVRMGWSQAQLVDHMTASLNWQKQLTSATLGGTAAQTEAQIHELAGQYGVAPGSTWVRNQVKGVVRGDQTTSGIQEQIKNLAKHTYSAFADQIDAGKTMDEIADPYRQQMAQLLEVDPATIGVRNNTLQKALTNRNEQGHASPMTMTDFNNLVRADPRWQYTSNAKQQVAQSLSMLGQAWGLD